ncbi:MAG: hypothetical protein ACRDHZ_22940, partial [Ktedonobacteraceae bacterium]
FAILLYSSATQRTHRFMAKKNVQESKNIYALLAILQDLQANSLIANGDILTSFDELSQQLGVEEGALRVLLHGAEQVGLLQRGPDVITEAGIFVSEPISTLVAQFDKSDDQHILTQLLEHLSTHQSVSLAVGRTDWRANYSAKCWLEAGGDALEATRLLNHLSEIEPKNCIFRPYARGIYLHLLPYSPTEKEAACRQLSAFFTGRYARFEQRLQDMLDYIHETKTSCLPAFIEHYLSGETHIPPCGKCGYCTPHYPVPWNELLVEANIAQTQPAQQVAQADVTLIILSALKDHNGYFSQNTLVKMLLGEAFGRSSNGKSYQLPSTARYSEHFGELKNYVLKEQHVRDKILSLSEKGYILSQERLRSANQESLEQTTYTCLTLSPIGRDFLAGEVLEGMGRAAH